MKRSVLILLAFVFILGTWACSAEEDARPRNIIILIGDGMSFAHFQAGMLASEHPLNIEKMRHIGMIKTSSADNFITDSGAAGTALATGFKTNNGFIGMDPEGNPLKSILHMASDNGLSTGVVVTCAVTHATPAAFVAHQPSRNMAEAIALDFLSSGIDVFIGGGRNHFENREDGRNLLNELIEAGYQLASDMDEVKSAGYGKLAGLIAPGHLPRYDEDRGDMLPEAVSKTIDILDQNSEGFFLMVESSQIDWGGHDNDVEYVVNEMLDFDHAIGVALEFARQDGQTLVIVTSDHDTGGMALLGFDKDSREISAGWATGGHTGLVQPVFSWGPGSELFTGVYENTGVFDRMLELSGFSRN
jgi:alkaline phosphatase